MRSNLLVIRSGYTDNCIAIGAARPDVTVPPALPVIPSIEIAPGTARGAKVCSSGARHTGETLVAAPRRLLPEHTPPPTLT